MQVLSETMNAEDIAFFERIMHAAVRILSQPEALSVGVELVGEEEIHAVNFETRGVDRATDVLSFPTQSLVAGDRVDLAECAVDIDPETGELYLGDVLICDRIAREHAAEYGHSVERERGYLFCHALLHLLGYDHVNDGEKRAMRREEEAIMRAVDLTRD